MMALRLAARRPLVRQQLLSPASVVLRRSLATVKICGDEAAFASAKDNAAGSVVYFTASWCGPCRMISPVYEELAAGAADDKVFLKVDVDDQAEVSQDAGISAMPTFHFYKGGKLVDKIVGADVAKLESLTKTHLG